MRADLWQRGCERLAAELPDQQFNTWIRPLPEAEVADLGDAGATVTIRVPNRFKLDWIRTQYAGRIETALSELAGKPVRLDILLSPREGGARPAVPSRPEFLKENSMLTRIQALASASLFALLAAGCAAPPPQYDAQEIRQGVIEQITPLIA